MLSDEEKKAIESLIEIREFANLSSYKDTKISQLNAIDVVLNLIEKQSKEIEKLKENNGYHLGFIDGGIAKRYEYQDKIKAKIEEFKIVRDTILENEKEFNRPMMTYDLKRNDYCEKMLQSLLEKE